MQDETIDHFIQVRAVLEATRGLLSDTLLALYLHGSAVSAGLRPHSDIDLLAIIDGPMTDAQRRSLLSALLEISGHYPAPPNGPRCIELIVFQKTNLTLLGAAPRAEFIYGEWLRNAFESGELPQPVTDPDLVLVLAQAAKISVPLLGPDAKELLPEISSEQIGSAMRATLLALLNALVGDERNVLLTLARIWRTATTGDFVSKDAAAVWAAARMPTQEASMLTTAHDEYLGLVAVDWGDFQSTAQRTAQYLFVQTSKQLKQQTGCELSGASEDNGAG